MLLSISLYKLEFIINSFYTFTAYRPLFFIQRPPILLEDATAPWFVPAPTRGRYRPLWETLPESKGWKSTDYMHMHVHHNLTWPVITSIIFILSTFIDILFKLPELLLYSTQII